VQASCLPKPFPSPSGLRATNEYRAGGVNFPASRLKTEGVGVPVIMALVR